MCRRRRCGDDDADDHDDFLAPGKLYIILYMNFWKISNIEGAFRHNTTDDILYTYRWDVDNILLLNTYQIIGEDDDRSWLTRSCGSI